MPVAQVRVRACNDAHARRTGDYVLYWMIAHRRTRRNWALEHAADRARRLDKPLLVFEALRCDYAWASDRLHRFVLDGMEDNRARCADAGAGYYAYVERERGAGKGLLAALADDACLVVTDEYPGFFLPRMVAAAGAALDVRLEAVDANGILPLRAADKTFSTAYSFRRFLQKEMLPWLAASPADAPMEGVRGTDPPAAVVQRWPDGVPDDLGALPIDHDVPPGPLRGGAVAGERALAEFTNRLDRYAADRNHPDDDVASGLSPYLHFGHVGAHDAFHAVAAREEWTPDDVADAAKGKRAGWWGMSEGAEAFLDQLVTWRELGYNMSAREDDCDSYDAQPDWAKETLAEHAGDEREHVYDLAAFERAGTHDELWNAAQRQLVREGRLHNYLRMLWGKKVLEWTPSPEKAAEVMIELNNKYALDGRDPNSYSGIFWVLGRYDRAWGPERDVFGKIRYMTSKNTAKKVRVKEYLARYGPE